MVVEGHTVGNHSMHHDHDGVAHLTGYWRREIEQANELVFAASGVRPSLFRPPMGFKTPFQRLAVRGLGMKVIGWNRRAFDTRAKSAEQVLGRIMPGLSGGDIVLLHDVLAEGRGGGRNFAVDALGRVIDGMEEKGLKGVSIGSWPLES
jgi:peptidoglycan/xylan/chitin deacetylase (PgdA/CDA1 family)